MKLVKILSLFLIHIFICQASFAQDIPQDSSLVDTSALETEEINVIDIIFQRSLLLGATSAETDIKNSSGSSFVGLGFKLPLVKNKAGFRVAPGFAWMKLNYDSINKPESNIFPDLTDSLGYTFQRHRISYIQLPVGIYVNFNTDEKGRPQIFGEIGGYVGYRVSRVLRYGQSSVREQQIRTKVTNIPDTRDLQYGLYGRLGYKKIAFYGQYRLERLFAPKKTDLNNVSTEILNPTFPQLELGVTILL